MILGVDVGTTGVKVVAFPSEAATPQRTGSGPHLSVAVRRYPLLHPRPGYEVQDPEKLAEATISAIAECSHALPRPGVEAVCLSAAMHGLLGVDAHLQAVTPLLTWADRRAEAQAAQLADGPTAAELLAATGLPPHPMTALAKILWFQQEDEETASRVRYWCGLKEYLTLRLAGQLLVDPASAAASGLLSRRTLEWDPLALHSADIETKRLAPIAPATSLLTLRPEVARACRLSPTTPLVLGASDGVLANVGVGALSPGVGALSLGTSGAVRVTLPAPLDDPSGRLFSYPLLTGDAPLWVCGAATSNGAEVVRWLAEDLLGNAGGPTAGLDTLLDSAAGVDPGAQGLVIVPSLLTPRPPSVDGKGAALLGLQHYHGHPHVVRAGLEGVCHELSGLTTTVAAHAPLHQVRATGGAFVHPLWRQVLAAALDTELYFSSDQQGTARGAAAIGLLALGRAKDLSSAVRVSGSSPADLSGPEPRPSAEMDAFAARRRRLEQWAVTLDQGL